MDVIRELQSQIAALQANQATISATTSSSPFIPRIRDYPPHPEYKYPTFRYDGRTSARDHTEQFRVAISLLTDRDELFCKAFPATLSGKAMSWFAALKTGSISSWSQLQRTFLNAFATAGALPKDKSDLSNIKQRRGETTLQYLQRFKQTLDDIQGLSEEVIMTCFEGGILPGTVLKTEFGARPPTSVGEML